jgi:hypothetical protein
MELRPLKPNVGAIASKRALAVEPAPAKCAHFVVRGNCAPRGALRAAHDAVERGKRRANAATSITALTPLQSRSQTALATRLYRGLPPMLARAALKAAAPTRADV